MRQRTECKTKIESYTNCTDTSKCNGSFEVLQRSNRGFRFSEMYDDRNYMFIGSFVDVSRGIAFKLDVSGSILATYIGLHERLSKILPLQGNFLEKYNKNCKRPQLRHFTIFLNCLINFHAL